MVSRVLLQYKVARIFLVVLVCCNVIAFGFWVVARALLYGC